MSEKPNVLLIMTDQHRFDCFGYMGNPDVKTPNIDSLAEDGTYFTNSFCAASSCTPSRYSLLTGMYPYQHRGITNESTILSNIETYPNILNENGYTTKIVGKLHSTPTYLDVGFSEMTLAEQTPPGRYEDDYHAYLSEQGIVNEIDVIDQVLEYRDKATDDYWDSFGAKVSNIPEEYDSTSWIADKAYNEIQNWTNHSNFLKVSFIKPHHPFNPPLTYAEMYDPEEIEVLPGWTEQCLERDLNFNEGYFSHSKLTKEKLKKVMSYYYANITHIDHEVGRLLKLLKEKKLYENTMIIFTSDHGEYLGFHHMLLKGNRFYDPLAKVPLIIKRPNHKKTENCSEELVSSLDIAPTIIKETCNISNSDLPGKQIFSNDKRNYVIAQTGINKEYMIRTDRYKLLLTPSSEKTLFFDLLKDPYELNNLYFDTSYSGKIKEHKKLLLNEVLFNAPNLNYVDYEADQVKEPNKQTLIKQMNKEKMGQSKLIK